MSFLESRLRSGRADIPVLGIRSTANPGGPGHGEVRKRYITPTDYGAKVITDERGRTVRFIPSKLSDNQHVNPEYAADLKALPERLRKAFLEGDWSAFEGQMYSELSLERHRVKPFTIPPTWTRYVGVDWGYTAPWAVGWFALDEDGRVWLYREIYEKEVGEAEQARRILAAEAADEHIAIRYADDAMWATRGDARPISDIYAQEGCHLTPAGKGPGSRVAGWQRIHSYLADGPACPHHRSQGWSTCPMLHAFTTCPRWFEEMSNLPHATTGNPEDADTKAPDHMADLTRYVLINLGGGPQFLALDEPVSSLAAELGPWEQRGQFAYRPDEREPDWGAGDEDHSQRGMVQRSPFG